MRERVARGTYTEGRRRDSLAAVCGTLIRSFKPLLTGCLGNGKQLYLHVLVLEGRGGQQILRKRTRMRLYETSRRRRFKKSVSSRDFYAPWAH